MLKKLGKKKNSLKKIMTLLILIFLFTHSRGAEKPSQLPSSGIIGSQQWIQEKLDIYPELNWLLSEDVEHTQEGTSLQHNNSWSVKIKGNHYPEFERTIATLVNLHLVLQGNNEAFKRFIESQPSEEALTKENFNDLHNYAISIINNQTEQLKAVEADLILGDMGKTPTARKLAKEFHIDEHDHDIFLSECLTKCPSIFPTFSKLSLIFQKDIRESTGLVHFGHVSHLEGDPDILAKLKKSQILSDNPQAFNLLMLTYILDVSGARAHESNLGAKALTNNTYQTIKCMKESLQKLATGSEIDAISSYIALRAGLLGLNSFKPEDCVLTRIGAMTRLFRPEDGKVLKETFKKLSQNEKILLIQQYDPFQTRDERTSTYIPAVFINFIESAIKQGYTRETALQKCLQNAVLKIAGFLKNYREGKAGFPYSPSNTLNFNKLAGQIRQDNTLLTTHKLHVDKDGYVILVDVR